MATNPDRPFGDRTDSELAAEATAIVDGFALLTDGQREAIVARATELAHQDDEPMVRELAEVRDTIAKAKIREAELVDWIAKGMHGQQERRGPWRVERRWGSPRSKWASESLFGEMCARSSVDADGQMLNDTEGRRRLIDMLHGCLPLTASLGWRTTALRSFGIDPDDWSEKGQGSWRVEVIYDPQGKDQ